jgi:hypothetical protein
VHTHLDTMLKYSKLVTEGGNAKTEDEKIPEGEKIQSAILRFMVRCLAGELEPTEPLSKYINLSKKDIWDEDVLKKVT